MEDNSYESKNQTSTAGSTTSNKNDVSPLNVNNNLSMSDTVSTPSWNVVSSTNISRNIVYNATPSSVSDNTNSSFNHKTPMMNNVNNAQPKYTDRSTFHNGSHGIEVQPTTSENVTEFNDVQTHTNGVNFNIRDSMNGVPETSTTVQIVSSDIDKAQENASPTNFNSAASNAGSSRINSAVAKGIVMPAVVIPEDSQGSMSLIRPSYFVPGQAQPKTLDEEGIKMMKSGNKILLPKLEGAQGFVVPGPSQVLIQTTNKTTRTNDENLAPKPEYSYASMICQAIFASSEKKSTLAEIYEWISTVYPFFKRNQQGWKNSIRHNLSLNAAFIRTSRGEGATGKGGYWMVDPIFERYFVNGHFKPPGNEAKGSCKRAKSDENEVITTTNTTIAVTNKKNSSAQNSTQTVRERLRQVKDNIEAAVQITLQLRGEKEVRPSKKRARVEVVENVEKVTETMNGEGTSGPEKGIEKMIRKIAEGCEEVYRKYYDGNDPNWRGDAEYFASFNPFL